MKCMKCGEPVDDLNYYCKSCRGEFYLPARNAEHEEKPAVGIGLDTGSLLDNLTNETGKDSLAGWKQMISYLLLKLKIKQSEETKSSFEYDPPDPE